MDFLSLSYPASVAAAQSPGPNQYCVTVTLFDADSGKRVTDATVRARVAKGEQSSPEKALEPVTIAGSTTYGGYCPVRDATLSHCASCGRERSNRSNRSPRSSSTLASGAPSGGPASLDAVVGGLRERTRCAGNSSKDGS